MSLTNSRNRLTPLSLETHLSINAQRQMKERCQIQTMSKQSYNNTEKEKIQKNNKSTEKKKTHIRSLSSTPNKKSKNF